MDVGLLDIVNMAIAALMYTLIGRYILSLFFPADSTKTIWVAFKRITDPLVRVARWLSPAAIPDGLMPVIAVIWLLGLRVGLVASVIVARSAA